MKKPFSLMLFAALGLSAWAEGDGNYYYFYDAVKASPTGKGVIYAAGPENTTEPTESDYQTEMEVKHMVAGFSTSSIYVWAKPADGYQFAGWYNEADEKVASAANGSISVSTLQSTENEPMSEDDYNYGFLPDATYMGVFAKVGIQFVPGQDNATRVGTLDISKPANDTGDEITITATPANASVKFDYWTDSKGNKITDNPYSLTVGNMETYTAHFSGDSILTFNFGQAGTTFIPFSNSLSAQLAPGMKAYRVAPVAQKFYDESSNEIAFDETENAWGHWEYEYDENWNITSSTFVKYEGEIPTFDSSYELQDYGYNYTATDGAILTGEGEMSILLYQDEYAYLSENFIKGTADGPVDIATLPQTDEEGNALTYYVFNGRSFVKATSGIVPQGQCYLVLDAAQYPAIDTLAVGPDNDVEGDIDGNGQFSISDITKLIDILKASQKK